MGRKQPKTIGAALRRARLTKGMTQQEVSEIAAIAPETLSRLERNKVAASLDLTARLAAALGVKVDDLLNPPKEAKRSTLRPAEARLLNLVNGLDEPQVHELVRALKILMELGAAAGPLRKPT